MIRCRAGCEPAVGRSLAGVEAGEKHEAGVAIHEIILEKKWDAVELVLTRSLGRSASFRNGRDNGAADSGLRIREPDG